MASGPRSLEDVELAEVMLKQVFSGRRVFITGNTGFKGTWLTALLKSLGAEVTGYALLPESKPSMYDLIDASSTLERQYLADVRDRAALMEAVGQSKPDIILHLAAQAFVRRSYVDPISTWDINVLGTVNLLEAVREHHVPSALVVTTDKCYENLGWDWGYREVDALGGHDPYSASKAGAELVAQSYRRSFFSDGRSLVASARAGNVIGGGDWSPDRLIADIARATVKRESVVIRNPASTRPWQHVLDCLHGYLLLAARLMSRDASVAAPFNFGPHQDDNVSVSELLSRLAVHWPEFTWREDPGVAPPHEASYLYLDSSRALRHLAWQPVWSLDVALAKTAEWYRAVSDDRSSALAVTKSQLADFLAHASLV